MSLVTPEFGLIFWQTIILGVVLVLLSKFAWQPILHVIGEREKSIETALREVEEAKKCMVELEKREQNILEETRIECGRIVAEAMGMKDHIIEIAHEEAEKIKKQLLIKTEEEIVKEKEVAFSMFQSQMALLVIQITEKLLCKELQQDCEQQVFLNHLIKETRL